MWPAAELLSGLARALRLDRDEVERLCRLAGRPGAVPDADYVDPGLICLLDALSAVPACVLDEELTVVKQNALSELVLDRCAGRPGHRSNLVWHWFTAEKTRSMGTPGQQSAVRRTLAAGPRTLVAWHGSDSTAGRLAADLAGADHEFARLWTTTSINRFEPIPLTIEHELVGRLDVYCDLAVSLSSGHRVLMLRPKVGTPPAIACDNSPLWRNRVRVPDRRVPGEWTPGRDRLLKQAGVDVGSLRFAGALVLPGPDSDSGSGS